MSDGMVVRENRARSTAYRKDETLERALLAINESLAPYEPDAPDDLAPLPNLFVIGLPRSGTTLTHQVLAWALDVGYVSNLMARFWLAPHAGAILSRAVLGTERDGSFASKYGKSTGLAGGHEFAYFWQHWLGIHEVDDLLDFSGDGRADWAGAGAAVRRVLAAFEKPLLFKTNYAAQFLPGFARTFPMPLFVHVRRDPLDVALSILEARRRYYDDVSTWWGTYPPEYEELAARPFAQQIAGQVVGLSRAYAAQVGKVPAELTVEADYRDLCDDPVSVVERIRRRCDDVHGIELRLLNALPERFEPAPPRTPASEEEIAVAEALSEALARDAE